jgi:hypothetical protein
MSTTSIKMSGTVILSKFSKGSKSDHEAVFLDTGDKKYRLKRRGGNPFFDETLHDLVGKKVELEGKVTKYFFEIMGEPTEVKVKKGK